MSDDNTGDEVDRLLRGGAVVALDVLSRAAAIRSEAAARAVERQHLTLFDTDDAVDLVVDLAMRQAETGDALGWRTLATNHPGFGLLYMVAAVRAQITDRLPGSEDVATRAARIVLGEAEGDDAVPDGVDLEDAIVRLARALRPAILAFLDEAMKGAPALPDDVLMQPDEVWEPMDAWAVRHDHADKAHIDGVLLDGLWLNGRLARFVERFGGERAVEAAAAIRAGGVHAWQVEHSRPRRRSVGVLYAWGIPDFWPGDYADSAMTGAPLALQGLALAVWRARVQLELGWDRDKAGAALVLPFAMRIDVVTSEIRVDGNALVDEAGGALPLAPTADARLAELARRLPSLRRLDAQRFVRFLPVLAYEAARSRDLYGAPYRMGPITMTAERLAYEMVVDGGWEALAEAVGSASNKGADVLADVAHVFANTVLTLDAPGLTDSGVLVSRLTASRGNRHAPARVRMVLPSFWGPGVVQQIRRGSPLRKLVPVLPLPPMPGRREGGANEADYPGLAVLDWLATVALADHGRDLAKRGGAVLDWHELAQRVGVREPALTAALDRWRHDGPDGDARWVEVERGRWFLADRPGTADARRMLLEGGARSLRGQIDQARGKKR